MHSPSTLPPILRLRGLCMRVRVSRGTNLPPPPKSVRAYSDFALIVKSRCGVTERRKYQTQIPDDFKLRPKHISTVLNLVVLKLNLHRSSRVHIWEHGLLEGQSRVSVCAGHPSPKERGKEAPSLLSASLRSRPEIWRCSRAICRRRHKKPPRWRGAAEGGRETVDLQRNRRGRTTADRSDYLPIYCIHYAGHRALSHRTVIQRTELDLEGESGL